MYSFVTPKRERRSLKTPSSLKRHKKKKENNIYKDLPLPLNLFKIDKQDKMIVETIYNEGYNGMESEVKLWNDWKEWNNLQRKINYELKGVK